MTETVNNQALFRYVLALGDDALIHGQRLSEWCSAGPFLEEDLALTNVALDYLGRARMFYEYAALVEGGGRTEDDLAFLRTVTEYHNHLLYELPRGDFAFTMARQLLIDLYNVEYLSALCNSRDETLAAIATRCLKESQYHLRRSREWVVRLGDGTDESHSRVQKAFDELWGYTHEMFQSDKNEQALTEIGIAVDYREIREQWDRQVDAILAEATLERPNHARAIGGGRNGIHTEAFGPLLAELQYMQRAYPGLEW
jgi:ring-1,2-phenylacetyl-CoA epoxidase subunit PaaC